MAGSAFFFFVCALHFKTRSNFITQFSSATFTPLLDLCRAKRMMGTQRLMVTVGQTSLHSALPWPEKTKHFLSDHLKMSYIHGDVEPFVTVRLQNWQYYYIPSTNMFVNLVCVHHQTIYAAQIRMKIYEMIDANLGELTNDTLMCKNPSNCWGCKVKVACDVPVSLLNSFFQTSSQKLCQL